MNISGLENYLIRYVVPGVASMLVVVLAAFARFDPSGIPGIGASTIAVLLAVAVVLGFLFDAVKLYDLVPGSRASKERLFRDLDPDGSVRDNENTTVSLRREVLQVAFLSPRERSASELAGFEVNELAKLVVPSEMEVTADVREKAFMVLNLSLVFAASGLIWVFSMLFRVGYLLELGWLTRNVSLRQAAFYDEPWLYFACDGLLVSACLVFAVRCRYSGLATMRRANALTVAVALSHSEEIRSRRHAIVRRTLDPWYRK